MPRWNRPDTMPEERNTVAVIGIHVRLDLEYEAGDFLVVRAHRRQGLPFTLAFCTRGAGASCQIVSSSSLTPKWRSAEPNTTGVMWPSR